MRRAAIALIVLAGATAVPTAEAATSCKRVVNPYAGTRYDGVDLTRITAAATSCRTARRVARGAHRKALGLTPTPSGIRTFRWRSWRVTGDLRGSNDSYVATSDGRRVRWRF